MRGSTHCTNDGVNLAIDFYNASVPKTVKADILLKMPRQKAAFGLHHCTNLEFKKILRHVNVSKPFDGGSAPTYLKESFQGCRNY